MKYFGGKSASVLSREALTTIPGIGQNYAIRLQAVGFQKVNRYRYSIEIPFAANVFDYLFLYFLYDKLDVFF